MALPTPSVSENPGVNICVGSEKSLTNSRFNSWHWGVPLEKKAQGHSSAPWKDRESVAGSMIQSERE